MSGLQVFFTALLMSLAGSLVIVYNPRIRRASGVAPVGDRWHRQITPGLGGIPMFLAFSGAIWFGDIELGMPIAGLLTGALLLFVAGVVDDLGGLSAGFKLLAQLIAAFLVVAGLTRLSGLELQWFHMLAAVLWLVMSANGINLLDNMDGLAGGVALISCLAVTLVINNGATHLYSMSVVLAAMIGALAGFLVLNINPAKLFMGDSGSQWLGLVTGAASLLVLTMSTSAEQATPWIWLIPMFIMAVPMIDTSFVIVTRTLRGQAVTQGGRDHLSHRLVGLGYSERLSVFLLWLLSFGGACVALAIVWSGPRVWLPLLGGFLASVIVIVRLALRVCVAGASEA